MYIKMDTSGSGLGQVADSCKCHDEFRGFHKMQGTSCLDKGLVASQERLFRVVIPKFEPEPGPYRLCACEFLNVFIKFHATLLIEVMIK